jgi:hypothetical protein
MRIWEEDKKGTRYGNFRLEKLPDGRTLVQNVATYSVLPQVLRYQGKEYIFHQGDMKIFGEVTIFNS